MQRRQFLGKATLAAAAAALGDAMLGPRRVLAAGCAAPAPAVQLFTVRDALGKDVRAALAQLRVHGIVEVELYGLNGPESTTLFGLPLADLKHAFDSAGMSLPSSHIGGALTNTADVAALARTLGIDTLIVARPNEFGPRPDGSTAIRSRGDLDVLTEKLNRAGREYREHGITFGYHNHDVEFRIVDGIVPYDYLMNHTDPALVKIELDIGWLAFAGLDPVAYLRRYAGRVIACHLKDFAPSVVTDVAARKLVAPGAGTVDFSAVLRAMNETGVRHGFIEIDVSDDPMGDVHRGREHLASREC